MTDEKLDLLLRQALNLEIADHDIQIDAAKIKQIETQPLGNIGNISLLLPLLLLFSHYLP